MIPVEELLYDVEFKLNKVATDRNQNIPREDILIALNEAQIQLIKQKLNRNNIYKLGLDTLKKRMDDLRVLIPDEVPVDIVKSPSSIENKYIASLSTISDYMFHIRIYLQADKGSCTGRMINVNDFIPHADLDIWLYNEHLKPSFEYQETIATLSEDGIEVYTDGSFVYTKLYLLYIRYPLKVDYPGYIHLDGTNSSLVNCELPYYLKDELVDLCIQELAMSTENVNALDATNQRISNNE